MTIVLYNIIALQSIFLIMDNPLSCPTLDLFWLWELKHIGGFIGRIAPQRGVHDLLVVA